MGQIFISYSRRDLEIVNLLVEKMQGAGINVWIDREEIKAGKLWRSQIVEAIDICDAFVLMLSSSSAASENVRKEVDLAQDSGRTIFIMNLDQVKIPADMRYQLAGLQFIDLKALGIGVAINELIETLKVEIKPKVESPVHQAELVIHGVDPAAFGPEIQAQLLDFISKLVQTPASQLHIANITAGSVHLFVDMPVKAAFELKTLALNRDRRFKQFGIQALKLIGDKRYINISLGILMTTATIGFLKSLWVKLPALFPSIFGATAGKIIVITVAVATTIVAITTVTSPTVPISKQVTLISVPFRETNESPDYRATAEIPQLTGSNDSRVEAFNGRLNEIIKNQVNMKRQYVLETEADGSSLEIKYELVSQIADIWSLRLDISFYFAGAAHPGLEATTVNYDLGQGKELMLGDLFLPGASYLELIAKYCTAELSKQVIDFDMFSAGTEPTPENYSNWNITANGIQITFEPGIVDAYASGPKTVQVPYSALQSIIDPKGPLGTILR